MSTTTEPAPKPPAGRRFAAWAKAGASGAARGVGRGAKWAGTRYWDWSRTRWQSVRDAETERSKRVLNLAALIAGWGAALGAAVFTLVLVYAILLIPFTPRVATLEQALEVNPSVVFSSDGTELTTYARSGREWVGLDEVSPHVVDALLSTEDRRFYSHGGIDMRRTAGAVVRTLSGDREGGSSITQQLARNLFPESIGREASLTRKLKEAITAIKIERVYTKDQILEIYLNSVPFLYNAVGIERAAHTYFSKDADDLSLVESATLVAMLKGTSYYNPRQNPERALARRNLVLRLMVANGRLGRARGRAAERRRRWACGSSGRRSRTASRRTSPSTSAARWTRGATRTATASTATASASTPRSTGACSAPRPSPSASSATRSRPSRTWSGAARAPAASARRRRPTTAPPLA